MGVTLTHWKKLVNPNYLGAYSIENGQDLILTIGVVKQETVIGTDGKSEDCIVCYFTEPVKPMILNSTNAKQIQKLLNTPYIEQWSGHRIQVGIEKVKAFGEVVEALRVRRFLPKADKAKSIKCELCGAEITAFGKMNADELAAYRKDRYGKVLCNDCAKKQAEADKAKSEVTDAGTAEDEQG